MQLGHMYSSHTYDATLQKNKKNDIVRLTEILIIDKSRINEQNLKELYQKVLNGTLLGQGKMPPLSLNISFGSFVQRIHKTVKTSHNLMNYRTDVQQLF